MRGQPFDAGLVQAPSGKVGKLELTINCDGTTLW